MNDSNPGVLVAGIDSSTQSATIVIKDAASGQTLRSASVPHPPGTEVDPQRWWDALEQAIEEAGGLADVSAVSVGGQQHGMVALDKDGQVIRPALLWNDTRSAAAANDLINELGDGDNETGRARWASRVGVVPVASFTITKLRWLARNEPENAAKVAAVALPHDWLSWKLASQAEGALGIDELRTDASDASGTGYFDGASGSYQQDLLELGFGRSITLPRVVDPGSAAFRIPRALRHGILGEGATGDLIIGAGAGDNAAAAFGLGLELGDVALSIGTSGVVSAVSERPTDDPSGIVASFRDASGHFLPLACTLNGSPVFDAVRALLQVGHEEFSELALSAAPGSEGLTLVPYFAGERTPNLPDATGALHGATTTNLNRQNLARSAVEGVLSGLADALDAVREGGHEVARVFLIGGAARSHAVQELAPSILGVDVLVPQPDEYVAAGAARQAAWALAGSDQPPVWPLQGVRTVPTEGTSQVREQVSQRYEEARGKFLGQLPTGR